MRLKINCIRVNNDTNILTKNIQLTQTINKITCNYFYRPSRM